MKQYAYIVLLLFSIGYLFTGCTGQQDETEDEKLVLIPDKTTLKADGKDQITFRVELSGKNVTSESVIYSKEESDPLQKSFFVTNKVGEWTFYAEYRGEQSAIVRIESTAKDIDKIRYTRHICLMKFTGTWCAFCPSAGRGINYVLENEKYKNAHLLAFYGGNSKEPMLIPETDLLMQRINATTYPTVYIDMREGGSFALTQLKEFLDHSLEDPAYYGVGIVSNLNSDQSVATVEVEIASGGTSTYRIVLYALENGLVYAQNDNGITDDDFIHDHVVRRLCSQSIIGDDIGILEQGKTITKRYTIQLDEKWKPENLSFYALVIDETTGFVHNMACCTANEGKMNYTQE